MSLISRTFAAELSDKEMRDAYLSAQTRTHLSYQIRTIRGQRGWSQEEFAERLNTSQSAVSRMEDRQYGKQNLQTLVQIANAFDCGLLVQFVPYDEFIRKTDDLSQEALEVSEFNNAALLPLAEDLPAIEAKPDLSTVRMYISYNAASQTAAELLSAGNFLRTSSQLASAAINPDRQLWFSSDLHHNQNAGVVTPTSELETENARLKEENARLKEEVELYR